MTKSNTTSRNALEIIKRQNLKPNPELMYVTRAYQTRNGAGPFPEQHKNFTLKKERGEETNIKNQYQGEFKVNFLNIDDLKRAINYDDAFSIGLSKNFMLTCIDHIPDYNMTALKDGKLIRFKYNEIVKMVALPIKNIFYSFSNCAEDILK